MFIADRMTAKPVTVLASETLATAAELLRSKDIHHLPVVDASDRLVGIISDRDVRSATGFDRHPDAQLTVAEVMTSEPRTLPLNSTLDEALDVFCTARLGALPVVSSGQLVGIISRRDLLQAFHDVLGLGAPGVRIEVALPNGPVDLAHAFEALKDCGDALISAIVSQLRKDGSEPSLYLRVQSAHARDVERRLRDATLILLLPEQS